MKKTIVSFFIIIFCISLLSAIDIDFTANAGNMKLADRDPVADQAKFSGKFFGSYDFDLSIKTEISPNLSVISSLGRNSITQNYVSSALNLSMDSINFTMGPWFGVANKATSSKDSLILLIPGLTMGVEAGIPGKINGFFDTTFTFSTGDQVEYNISVNRYLFGTRFWVPNVVCTLQVEQTTNKVSIDSITQRTNTQTDAGFYADVYSKGVPFRVLINLIYREFEKKYIDLVTPISPEADKLVHLVTGIDLTFQPTPSFQFSGGFEAAVYSFYRDKRSDTSFKGNFPFSVSLGMAYKFGEK